MVTAATRKAACGPFRGREATRLMARLATGASATTAPPMMQMAICMAKVSSSHSPAYQLPSTAAGERRFMSMASRKARMVSAMAKMVGSGMYFWETRVKELPMRMSRLSLVSAAEFGLLKTFTPLSAFGCAFRPAVSRRGSQG